MSQRTLAGELKKPFQIRAQKKLAMKKRIKSITKSFIKKSYGTKKPYRNCPVTIESV